MLAASFMFVALNASAQPGKGFNRGQGRGMGPGMGSGNGPFECNRLDAWLDLSEDQQGKIENLRLEF